MHRSLVFRLTLLLALLLVAIGAALEFADYALTSGTRGQPALADPNSDRVAVLRRRLQFVQLGILVGGLGVGYLIARRFTRPIAQLAAAAKRVAAGDLSVRVDGNWQGELHSLHQAFNDMTVQLQSSYETLERRVAERTERLAESEGALRRQSTLLQSILDSIGDGVVVADRDGKFLQFNPAAERILGMGKIESPPTEWAERYGLYLPDAATPYPPEQLPLARAIRGEAADGVEIFVRRESDERSIWVNVNGRPLRDERGEVQGGVVVFRDVTLRKRAERALRDFEARYRSLIESLPLTTWSKDLEGRFTFANHRFCETVGQPLDCVVGRTDYDFFPPDLAVKYLSDDRRVAETGEVFEDIERFQRPGGDESFVQVFKAPVLDSNGRVVGTQGMARDVTSLKRTESALRRAKDEAESANRAKSVFLANMSHEIRTPMNGVLGVAALLEGTSLSPQQREYLGLIRSSAEALLSVINGILDFSKIEAGKLDLDREVFSLRDVMEDAVRCLAPRSHEKQLELICDVADDVPDNVVGDPSRLRQVLVNLVGNAIRFTEHGEVIASVCLAPDAVVNEGSVKLQFCVRDTGIGIPSNKLAVIFEPFEQADASPTRRHGGAGLGLAISHKLVEKMGGEMRVESQQGIGSAFYFTAVLEIQPTPTRPPAMPNARLGRVLVVDDHPLQREILLRNLKDWGMEAAAVASADEAWQVLERSGDFAALVIDVGLPKVDGFTLAQKVRRDARFAALPQILLTVAAGSPTFDDGLGAGKIFCLLKPARRSELQAALLTALRGGDSDPASPTDARAGARGLRILLAEDSAVNRTVARGLLERRGHQVVEARDGQSALDLFDSQPFDAIVMDVQMPELDGLAAATAIREREQHSGGHIPIVALTAHAMKGDLERCLAAGMDAYVAKPVDPAALFAAIENLSIGAARSTSAREASSRAAIDWDIGLARAGGDVALQRDVVQAFVDECPSLVADMHRRIEAQDHLRLGIVAHTLKGSSATLGAAAAEEAAQTLETAAAEEDWGATRDAAARLERELDRLRPALVEFCLNAPAAAASAAPVKDSCNVSN